MDHLPWREGDPSNPRGRPRVPLLCTDEADICDSLDSFAIWPSLKDWNLSTLPAVETAQRYQAWLFLGFLRILTNLLGRPFRLDDWVSEKDVRYIDSTLLAEMLNGLRAKIFVTDMLEITRLSKDGRHIFACIQYTLARYSVSIEQIIREYECDGMSDDPSSKENEYLMIFWSTLLLYDRFCEWALDTISHDDQGVIRDARSSIPTIPRDSSLFTDFVKRTGRCPTVLCRTESRHMDIYRLMAIPTIESAHSTCERRYCTRFNITESDYIMQHLNGCSDCKLVWVCSNTLKDLIAKNCIPLVRSTLDGHGKLGIEIVDAAYVKDYTAISHVWAGGLGNFANNAHYECQLMQLHFDVLGQLDKQSSRKVSQVHYWLDTLYVPFEQGDLKTKAMDAMAAIYAGARTVLVLDPELRQLNSVDLSAREIDTAVFFSPWMARSWTLQEGALAIDLRLKFKDKAIPFSTFHFQGSLMNSTAIGAIWKVNVERLLPSFRPSSWLHAINSAGGFSPLLPHEKYLSVWNQLRDRSTTKPEDLGAIFATLLDRSASEALRIPHEERMHAFIRTQSALPVSLLFAPTATNASVWNPLFPSCDNGQYGLTSDMGYMQADISGEFVLSNFRHGILVELEQSLPMFGNCVVFNRVDNLCCHLYFAPGPSKGIGPWQTNVVLLLSKIEDHIGNKGRFKGMSFELLTKDDKGLHVRVLKSFEWSTHDGKRGSPRCVSSSPTHTTSSQESMMRIGFFSSIDVTPENPLYIDIGASTWHELQWSRSDFYPFIETSAQWGKPLYLFGYLSALGIGFCGVHCFTGIVVSFADAVSLNDGHGSVPRALLRLITYFIQSPVMMWGRWHLIDLEYQLFRARTHHMLQKVWAASFLPDINSKYMRNIRSINATTLMILVVFYGTLFACSTAGTGYLLYLGYQGHLWSFRGNVLNCLTAVLSQLWAIEPFRPSIGLIVIRPIFFMVFFELSSRLILLAYFDPLGMWRRRSSRYFGSAVALVNHVQGMTLPVFIFVALCLSWFIVVVTGIYFISVEVRFDVGIGAGFNLIYIVLYHSILGHLTPILAWVKKIWIICGPRVIQWSKSCQMLLRRLLGRHDREIQLAEGDPDPMS